MIVESKFFDGDKIIYVTSLAQARTALENVEFTLKQSDKNINEHITISNKAEIIYYLGIKVIHHIFCTLKLEFPIIQYFIMNVGNDNMAAMEALKLNYNRIMYNGNSPTIHNLLRKNCI